jgi:hypothetical protein
MLARTVVVFTAAIALLMAAGLREALAYAAEPTIYSIQCCSTCVFCYKPACSAIISVCSAVSAAPEGGKPESPHRMMQTKAETLQLPCPDVGSQQMLLPAQGMCDKA